MVGSEIGGAELKKKIFGALVAGIALVAGASAQGSITVFTGGSIIRDADNRCLLVTANATTDLPSATSSICQSGTPAWVRANQQFYSNTTGSWAVQTLTAPTIVGLTADPTTTVGVGTVGTGAVAVTESGTGAYHKTLFTFTAYSLTMTDAGAAGNQGGAKIYSFPQGIITVLNASCNTTTLAGTGGIADTGAAVESLGTVVAAVDNATLTSTEADIIASFAGTLSSGAGVFTKYASVNATSYDGHTTSIDMYLNAAVPDAGSSATDTLAFTGTCTVLWANAGDF